jgi:putative spermidine/putrescine transport system permease protein
MRMGLGTAILLLAAPVAFFALFFAGPFLVLAVESLSDRSGAPTAQHYVSVLTDSYYWKALANTLLISLYVTAFCFIAGYPIAYYLIFHLRSAWLRRFVYILLVTPLFTSNIVRAFGWIVILGRRGFVNSSLQSLGIIERPLDLLYSQFSIVVGLGYILLPVMVLTVCSVLQNVDRTLIEAARDLGARPSIAFAAMTCPLSLPGVVAGSIIVFALSVSAYVIPSILSGGREVVMSMLIFQQYTATFRPEIGATLSIVLLVVTLLLIGGYMLLFNRRARAAW